MMVTPQFDLRLAGLFAIVLLALSSAASVPAQTVPEIYVAAGHETLGKIDAVFSPDGKLLATHQAQVYNVIKIWDVQTGEELRSIDAPALATTDVVFFPDGKRFLWGDNIDSLSVVDVETGTIRSGVCPKETSCRATVYALSFDGRVVATNSSKTIGIEVFELDSLKPLLKVPTSSAPTRIALNGDGRLLAYFDEAQVKIVDVQSGNVIGRLASATANPMFGFSGATLVCRCGDASISGWNARTAARIYERRWNTGSLISFQLLTNGSFVTQDSFGKTKFWKADDGTETKSVDLNIGPAVFSPWSMVYQQENDDLVLFRFGDTKPSVLRNRANSVSGLAFGKDGAWITSADWKSVRIWRAPNVGIPFSVPIYGTKGITLTGSGEILSAGFDYGSNRETLASWTYGGGVRSRELATTYAASEYYYASKRVVSPDGKLLVSVTNDDKELRFYDTATVKEVSGPLPESRQIAAVRFSGDGTRLACLIGKQSDGAPSIIKLYDVATRRVVSSVDLGKTVDFEGKPIPLNPTTFAVSTRGDKVAVVAQYNEIRMFNAATGALAATSTLPAEKITIGLRFTPDGRQVVSIALDGSIWLSETGATAPASPFSARAVKNGDLMEFTRDGRLFGVGGGGRIVLFDFRDRRELVTLVAMPGDEWLAVSPDGRFDGSPGAFDAVRWRFSPKLYDIASAEAFFADFYYPGLLDEIFGSGLPPPVSNPASKDRRQSKVRVTLDDGLFYRSTSSRTVRLRISVSDSPAGAKDLRLFRNGTLVKVWRGDVLKGRTAIEFDTDVVVTEGDNRYSVYAFNSDNVKSREDSVWVVGQEALRRKRIAYVLAVGVNRYETPEFDLSYAATDASSFADAFGTAQTAAGEFDRVELTTLSDSQATKSAISEAIRGIARKAQPEDEVAIFFAGHGLAKGDRFYLIPFDLGYRGRRNQLGADGLRVIAENSISDLELEELLEPIAAERLFMVIDACNSGQALESEEKRRGPMNSRGLAQLAYEKGMYILTASQSYQLATESSRLGHGYLTYALLEDGLKKARADRSPADGKITVREWFDYAVERVPTIFTSENERKRQLLREGSKPVPAVRDESGQVPRVFYRREQERNQWLVASGTK